MCRRSDDIARHLLHWFILEARDLPWRRTQDPYAIWVSEIMLQQTQVKTVLGYYGRWIKALPDMASLARAGSEQLHKLWEGLGYYTRVRNMHRAALQILEKYGGQFPCDYEAVLDLPGIGRYTAGAICSIAFGQPTPILDGNVIRVLSRIFAVKGDPGERITNTELWRLAEALVTASAAISHSELEQAGKNGNLDRFGCASPCSLLNQSLMELGALICTPQNPGCEICPVRRHCTALKTGRVEELPSPRKRSAVIARRFFAFIVEDRGRFLVRKRPAGVVNANLWEFPSVEVSNGTIALAAAKSTLGASPRKLELIQTVRHSITRYRIELQAYACRLGTPLTAASAPGDSERWLGLEELRALPFTSAHRKILLGLK